MEKQTAPIDTNQLLKDLNLSAVDPEKSTEEFSAKLIGKFSEENLLAGSQFEIKNLFDKGEVFRAWIENDSKGQRIFDISASILDKNISPFYLTGNFSKNTKNLNSSCQNVENSQGIEFSVRSLDSDRAVSYIYNERETYSGENENSATTSIKSSITFDHFILKNWDSVSLPLRGLFMRNFYEFAGIGTDVKFFKISSKFGGNYPIQSRKGFSVFYSCFLGYNHTFKSLSSLDQPCTSLINDRFFFDGINNLNGYDMNTININSQQSIGCDIIGKDLIGLRFPLDAKPLCKVPLTGFVFIGGGISASHSHFKQLFNGSIWNGLIDQLKNAYYTIGTGIEWPLKQLKGKATFGVSNTFNFSNGSSKQKVQFGFKAEAP